MFKKPIWRIPLLVFYSANRPGRARGADEPYWKLKAEVVCKDVKIYIPGSQYFIDKKRSRKHFAAKQLYTDRP